ncbi:hypothetical protein MD484_g8215, partial [Candolleomyces efflorescens]
MSSPGRNYLHSAATNRRMSKDSTIACGVTPPGSPKLRPKTIRSVENLPRYTPTTPLARRKVPIEISFQREGERDKGLGISMRELKDYPDSVRMIDADHAVLKGVGSGKTIGLFLSWPNPLNTPRRPRQFVVDLYSKSGKDITRLEVGRQVAERFHNFFTNDLKAPIPFDALVLRRVYSEFERQLEIDIAVRV